MTPFFVKEAFVTLGVGSVLAPSDLLCDFSFLSYARFREGNPANAPKSLPPPHCEGTVCRNSPSALSAQAGQEIEIHDMSMSVAIAFFARDFY